MDLVPIPEDPYAVSYRFGRVAEAFCYQTRRWVWVPACAGTTRGVSCFTFNQESI
jgi:hypothetical protein